MAAVTTQEQTVRAEAKWVRLSARKARVVLEHIRGRSVPEARTILAFTQRAERRTHLASARTTCSCVCVAATSEEPS